MSAATYTAPGDFRNAIAADSCASTRIDPETLSQYFKGSNRTLAPRLLAVVFRLQEYWPMSVRQIYYQAVANLLVPNTVSSYRRIGGILKKLREEDVLEWNAIEDRARRTVDKRGLSGLPEFLQDNLETMLNWRYYHRCHLQGQPRYVEVTVEKDALAPLVEQEVWPLCTRMSVTKGQPSVTLMQQIAARMDAAVQRGQEPHLLHFGDLDPTGVQIPLSMERTLREVHKLDVTVRMGGLTPAQCVAHNLPQSLDAAQEGDANIRRWHVRFPGQAPTELDALHPAELKATVAAELLSLYDDRLMEAQREKEREDEDVLREMRRSMLRHLRATFPEHMREVRA